MIENYGQLKVLDEHNNLIPKVYVKCYAKEKSGNETFYRDGYTDLRGRFDYALSSSSDINSIEKFSILICSDDRGSLIKEAPVPSSLGKMEETITLKVRKNIKWLINKMTYWEKKRVSNYLNVNFTIIKQIELWKNEFNYYFLNYYLK